MDDRQHARIAHKNALDMPMGEFFLARMADHVKWWFIALCLGVWCWLCISMASSFGSFGAPFVLSGVITLVLAALGAIPLMLVLMLPSLFTIAVEAHWRVHTDRAYMEHAPAAALYKPGTPALRQCGGTHWLIPLAIGLWIGNAWGSDD